MKTIVGIKFKKPGKTYYFDPQNLKLNSGDKVIVETALGDEYGEVIIGNKDVQEESLTTPLKKVLRLATDKDTKSYLENKKKEPDALKKCEEKIKKHGLEMKLIDAEYKFDGSKLVFYFTAEGRIDFRELVKDLAAIFKTRIELRQIGVRDKAKEIGGIGPCGRFLCCNTFLNDFNSVSINMAKNQYLSLNPTKINGICGRLLCCLKYEDDTYSEMKKEYPPLGTIVKKDGNEGKVVLHNVFKRTYVIEKKDKTQVEVELD